MTTTQPPDTAASRAQAMRQDLGRNLAARRNAAGYRQRELAKITGYSRTAIANAETAHTTHSRDFWAACDQALQAGGALILAYDQIEATHDAHAPRRRPGRRTGPPHPGARTRRLLHAAGAGCGRMAIWPDEATISLWGLPPRDLAVVLFQMIETAADAAYYADLTQALIALAVSAPPGPPAGAGDFLARLDPGWLETAYTGGDHSSELAAVTAARCHLPDIALCYRTLLGRLGPALDGPGTLAGADAWYFILEGTREPSVAEAQAMALIELAAHAATTMDSEPRAMLLACDDYSAVSGQVPLWQLYERGRSLGIGVQVSAQSWHGLAGTEDERYRIAATADGGIWLLRTPYPQPLCELVGTRRIVETATKVIGGMWGDEGSSRVQDTWTVDPRIARSLDTGQAAYITRGGCTWVQIARPRCHPHHPPQPR